MADVADVADVAVARGAGHGGAGAPGYQSRSGQMEQWGSDPGCARKS
ncbi:MAG TPA: hypothetical protein VIS06_06355 [Mycobacteriales bacterium]